MSKKQFQIFVEGKADKKFLEDYLTHIKDELSIDILEIKAIGGKDKLEKILPIFELNNPNVTNIVIFDTDTLRSQNMNEIKKKISSLNFEIPVFLIPNDEDSGNLETLLEKIINKENSELFICWNNYIECLESKKKGYTTPNQKAKIFAYLEALLDIKESEKTEFEKRDYTNPNHWDLDSSYLNPLKTFLTNLK